MVEDVRTYGCRKWCISRVIAMFLRGYKVTWREKKKQILQFKSDCMRLNPLLEQAPKLPAQDGTSIHVYIYIYYSFWSQVILNLHGFFLECFKHLGSSQGPVLQLSLVIGSLHEFELVSCRSLSSNQGTGPRTELFSTLRFDMTWHDGCRYIGPSLGGPEVVRLPTTFSLYQALPKSSESPRWCRFRLVKL